VEAKQAAETIVLIILVLLSKLLKPFFHKARELVIQFGADHSYSNQKELCMHLFSLQKAINTMKLTHSVVNNKENENIGGGGSESQLHVYTATCFGFS
jgi:hypothetical protein